MDRKTKNIVSTIQVKIMKRDMDLVRLLILEVEGEEEVNLSGYTDEQKLYHKYLLIDAGLAEGQPHFGNDRLLAVHIFWQRRVMKHVGKRLQRKQGLLLSTLLNNS